AIERFCLRRAAVEQLIVSGGGARNPTLLGGLARRLPALEVQTSAALGLPAEAKESVAFALLAEATLRGAPGNLPGATGARHAAPLGKILRSERL
ncbi:MAG TPA: anhydro-N-acetylmuramic acid kinase, partial [Acidobacteriota bacterium]